MKRIIVLIGVIMGLLSMLAGCASKKQEAALRVADRFTNDFYYYGDDEEREPEPDPKPELVKLSLGEEIEGYGNFTVIKITEDHIQIRFPWEYYGNDGKLGEIHLLKKGEECWFTEAGLMDATHTVYVTYMGSH